MKDALTNFISSGLKYLVAALVAFLTGRQLLTSDQAAQLSAEAVGVIMGAAAFLAGLLTWVVQALLAKYFPRDGGNGGGSSGGNLLLALASGLATWGTVAGLCLTGLSSCSTPAGLNSRGWPVTLGITGPDGTLTYSQEAGLGITATIHGDK